MPKLPFMQFYPNDWLLDTRILTDEEKAVWIDLICFMWLKTERGKVKGLVDDLARMVNKTTLSLFLETILVFNSGTSLSDGINNQTKVLSLLIFVE